MFEPTQLTSLESLYCTFWLEGQCFGIPSSTVSEVHAPVPLTTIPGAPAAVRGYVNLRGQLYLVLDPGELLLGRPQPAQATHELIVFQAEVGEAFAIAVERVGDMLPIAAEQIHVPRARTDDVDLSSEEHRAARLIVGHATLATQLVMLVEARELLTAAFVQVS
jgi:chemotaxis signal transduction protein